MVDFSQVIDAVYVFAAVLSVVAVIDNLQQGLVSGQDKEKEPCSGKCTFCKGCIKDRYNRFKNCNVNYFIKVFFSLATVVFIFTIIFIQKSFYQEEARGVSATTVNIFGAAAATNGFGTGNERVWDATDLAVPASENRAFFITTKIVTTMNQTRTECAEPESVKDAHCTNDSECSPVGKSFKLGWGLSNGTCNINDTNTCFVHAWCPIEDGQKVRNGSVPNNVRIEVMSGIENIMILIKNHVYFEFKSNYNFGVHNFKKANIYKDGEVCTYNEKGSKNDHHNCPFFRMGDILDDVNHREELLEGGGVVSIRITWRCDVDVNGKTCSPTYHFKRLDYGEDDQDWGVSGYNFSDTVHSYYNHDLRHHTRSIGVLFIIEVDPVAYKASLSMIAVQIGGLLGFVATAAYITDLIALFCVLCTLCRKPIRS